MNEPRPPDQVLDTPRRTDRESVDRRLLEILVCPVTRANLRYDSVRQELISPSAHMAFPIRGGVPVMITDEARAVDS